MEGRGVKRDQRMAAQWFEKLAQSPIRSQYIHTNPCMFLVLFYCVQLTYLLSDVANGQFCYGQCLIDGIGVTQDTQEGITWMTKAAEHGNTFALLSLGNINLNGVYMAKNE